MIINNCTYNNFSEAVEHIIACNKLIENYQIIDLNKLKHFFEIKDCILSISKKSVVVLVPFFDFYEVYTYSTDESDLLNLLLNLKNEINNENLSLKLSLCTKKNIKETHYYQTLIDSGFTLKKQIARFRADLPNENTKKNKQLIIDKEFISSVVPEQYRNAEYAKESDAEQIFELLKSEFDPIGDSLPDYDELVENIRKNHVVCVKDKDRIICVHYFEVVNNMYYGLFDCTDKQYRHYFVYFSIMYFMKTEFLKHKYSRCYGWRDVTKKRINKFGSQIGQVGDGVMIYNLCYTKKHK